MFNLTPSMMTGIAQVDNDHHDLVAAINLIKAAEQEASIPDILKRLKEFRDHLAGHFKAEEHYLRMLRYPGADAHAGHHGEILAGLDRLLDGVIAGALEPGEIASQCFYDLMGAVVTMDHRFLNWHQEHKRRAE
jgi:hemerythrin-like metal-binding protein